MTARTSRASSDNVGWVKTDGVWYYLNADGSLLVNTTTPDRYSVGAEGARVG